MTDKMASYEPPEPPTHTSSSGGPGAQSNVQPPATSHDSEEANSDDNSSSSAEEKENTGFCCQPSRNAKSQSLSSSIHSNVQADSFAQSTCLIVLYHILGVLTFGAVYLSAYWRPDWKVYMCCNKTVLADATHLIIKDGDGPPSVCVVGREAVSPEFPERYRLPAPEQQLQGSNSSLDSDQQQDHSSLITSRSEDCHWYRHFTYQLIKFVWSPAEQRFVELKALDSNTELAELLSLYQGYTTKQRYIRYQLYGPNEITVEVRSYVSLLFSEVLNPYYIFQVPYELGVVRVLDFNSTLQRMSVVVRQLSKAHMELYCKGAPEVLLQLTAPDSVPSNVWSVLEGYTVQGFRVIALAHRNLPQRLTWRNVLKVPRDKLESNLTFIGLLVLRNPLKAASKATVQELREADIRTIMATGDNVLTGVSMARECGMIAEQEPVLLLTVSPPTAGSQPTPPLLTATITRSGHSQNQPSHIVDMPSGVQIERYPGYHLALSGTSWRLLQQYFPQYVGPVCCRGTVFGRMSPDDKSELVQQLIDLDYITAMCGDGANDCGALKAAHVGISLSEAEASVAAPFTSNRADVSCVPLLIKEGRASLVTNFSVFKYMAMYSLIQFLTVLMLYTFHTNLSDPQFLYIDLGIVTTVAIFMGYTHGRRELVKERPSSSLLGAVTLFSVLLQVLLVLAGQVAAYFYLTVQPWFVPTNSDDGEGGARDVSWEATVLFLASSLQYIALALVYSPGHPHRQPLYTNLYLLGAVLIFGLFSIAMLVYPGPWCSIMLMEDELEDSGSAHTVYWLFRFTLLLMAALHFVSALVTEDLVTKSKNVKRVFQWMQRKRQPKNRYKRVLAAMKHDTTFPPTERPIPPLHMQ